ncbi:hypothetical protein JCM21900_001835 [Sporobolomyces salmonicolor]
MASTAPSSPVPSVSRSASATPASSLLTPSEVQLLSTLSTTDKLLVAQAIYEKGNRDFAAVGTLLRGHVLLQGKEVGWFAPERLGKAYEAMVHNLGLDSSSPLAPNAPQLHKVAHKYYLDRVHELYAAMQLCQDQFRRESRIAYSEIQEIKDGKWDWKLLEPGRVKPPSPVRGAVALPE